MPCAPNGPRHALLMKTPKESCALLQTRCQPLDFQRTAAAFLAISERCSGVSFLARSEPPLRPPSLDALARADSSGSTACPVAISPTSLASWIGSRGRLTRGFISPFYQRRASWRITRIYRCEVCGHEDISTYNHPLPPQNHKQHPPGVPIRWRLIVAAHHNQ